MTFYLALTNSADTVWSAMHKRQDETWLQMVVEHSEGDFPKASVTVKNPRHPWLSPSMNVWVWLAKDDTPFFFGRLDVVPEELSQELVKLSFLCRPEDYEVLQLALAQTLKVPPFWDEVFINPDMVDNPNVVLEARSQLYHIDRTDLSVTVSDIINGEDGTVIINNLFYDSLQMTRSAAPVTRFIADVEVSWPQTASGTVDVTAQLLLAFKLAGSLGNRMSSFTGQGLEADHPEQFDNLKGGWSIGETTLLRVDSIAVEQKYKDVRIVPVATEPEETSKAPTFGAMKTYTSGEAAVAPPFLARFFLWEFVPTLKIDYAAKRQRIEYLHLEITADMQLVNRTISAPVEWKQQSKRVVELIDPPTAEHPDGVMPIGDPAAKSYFLQDRGRQTVEYIMMVGRAKLLSNSRAVEVSCAWKFDFGLQYSCRKNATIIDPRLPNGQASGKIVRYTLVANNKGAQYSTVTIGCAVGRGSAVVAVEGEGDYAEDDWDEDYQYRLESWSMPVPGELIYKDYSDTEIAASYFIDGVEYFDNANFSDLNVDDFINNFEVVNGETIQRTVLGAKFDDIPHAVETINKSHTEVILDMQAIDGVGPFITNYVVEVSPLQVPKMIDLETV